jgi:hypothetical protein
MNKSIAVGGARLGGPVSLVSLIGPAVETHVVVGSEQNFEWFPNIYLVRVMPRVHWQIHAHFQWQAGFGFRHFDGNNSAEASTRLIAEF